MSVKTLQILVTIG